MLATLRARAHGVSRLEGFSDDVFAFALTLLVVSLEVPRTFRDLEIATRGFLVFGLTFAVLGWIWHEHKSFFSRFPLDDNLTVFLNCVLLFLVLFYVYPLKFMTQFLLGQLGLAPERLVVSWQETPRLMAIYSTGFVAIFTVFALLCGHALRRRRDLDLDERALFEARVSMRSHLLSVAVGGLSLIFTALAPLLRRPWLVAVAGFSYGLLGPVHGVYGARVARRRRSLEADAPAVTAARSRG